MSAAEGRATIRNEQGLHFRPMGKLVQLAQTFPCDIRVAYEETVGDVKVPTDLIQLAAPFGAELTIRAEGERAEEAVNAIVELIHNRFGMTARD